MVDAFARLDIQVKMVCTPSLRVIIGVGTQYVQIKFGYEEETFTPESAA